MMWYDPLLFMSSSVCFHLSLMLCTYAFCDVLPLTVLFLLQVEVPPPTTGGTLLEEVITAPSTVSPSVEEEPPSGGVIEEVGQPMQDVQPILPSIPLAAQDSEALQPFVPQDLQPMQTFSPIKTVSLELVIEPVLSKRSLGGASSSMQAGELHSPRISMLNLISFIFSF